MPETFLARFPVSVESYSDPLLRPKMCRPSVHTENSRRTRERPLVPRVYSAWSILQFDWANVFLPLWVSHLATFRGYEGSLFYAYWVISSGGLFFGKCFLTRFDHRSINDFLLPLLKPSAFLLRLNNLSLVWFSAKCLDLNSYMCLVFLVVNIIYDFLICFDSRTVG